LSEAGKRLLVVAQLVGAFGVKGEAKVRSFTEDPEACFSYGPLLDAEGTAILTPKKVRSLGDAFGVITEEKRQREEWEALKGMMLYASREALPETAEDEIYVADLVGMDVVHTDGRALGKVKAAHNFGAGDLIEVAPPAGASFLLPFTEDVFPTIDAAARRLVAAPDEELLPERLQRQSD
jgi:16S rRNA processing protein RimM